MENFYAAKFLQPPRYITMSFYGEQILVPQQPTTWEFQESADYANWFDVIDLGNSFQGATVDDYFRIPCPEEQEQHPYDPNSLCYYTVKWLHPETIWIRARSIQEEEYWSSESQSFEIAASHSEWSEPLPVTIVPEPSSASLLLMAGIGMLAILNKWKNRAHK